MAEAREVPVDDLVMPFEIKPLGVRGRIVQNLRQEASEGLRSTGIERQPRASGDLLVLGRGDAGHRPDLGITDDSFLERPADQWQLLQCVGHAHLLPRRPEVESHPPPQPGGAGAEAGIPAPAGIELAEQGEEACGRGLEVRRQLGDLIAQSIQFCDTLMIDADSQRVDLHGVLPSAGATVHLDYRAIREPQGREIPRRAMVFGSHHARSNNGRPV